MMRLFINTKHTMEQRDGIIMNFPASDLTSESKLDTPLYQHDYFPMATLVMSQSSGMC